MSHQGSCILHIGTRETSRVTHRETELLIRRSPLASCNPNHRHNAPHCALRYVGLVMEQPAAPPLSYFHPKIVPHSGIISSSLEGGRVIFNSKTGTKLSMRQRMDSFNYAGVGVVRKAPRFHPVKPGAVRIGV
jgi:hypothetical protein